MGKKECNGKQQTINQIMWKRNKQNRYTIQYHTEFCVTHKCNNLKLSQK